MDEFDRRAFADLLNAVGMKCFGHPLDSPLSEPESKHLSSEIEERTGLVVGWRSLKNYAAFVLNPSPEKQENPSVATLDTLARYVFDAPATTEADRKRPGEHFPYWFRYRDQVGLPPKPELPKNESRKNRIAILLPIGLVLVMGLIGFLFFWQPRLEQFQDDFHATDESSLTKNGWFLKSKNDQFWNRRKEKPACMTLFTLKGDNWPKAGETPQIQNLLLRKIPVDCFRTEVHLADFVPSSNWQQAGLLLLEDTLFTGKSIRLSLSYNNFFGGYKRPGEILIQGIASYGKGDRNLEEFIHQPLFPLGTADERRIAATNLKNMAFRIEKQGQKFRILYSASPVDNFSFKEITTYEFGMTTNFIGLFALKGFVDTTATMPVRIRYFRLDGQHCE